MVGATKTHRARGRLSVLLRLRARAGGKPQGPGARTLPAWEVSVNVEWRWFPACPAYPLYVARKLFQT